MMAEIEVNVTTRTSRPYAGEADLPQIAAFVTACDAADGTGNGTSVEELQQTFGDPSVDPMRNVRLWEDHGALVGYGELYSATSDEGVQTRLFFYAHPDAPDRDALGMEIVAWAERRSAGIGSAHDLPARLRVTAFEADEWRRNILERAAFAAERYALDMLMLLDGPLPEARLPAGFTLRAARADDAAMWAALYNESFADHWDYRPWTPGQFTQWFHDPDNDPELCLVALAPDGTFAAFCWCTIFAAENERMGYNEGHVDLLGTRPGYRTRGLGRAMLLEGLRRLQAAGVQVARIGVDAANPSGAGRLYESVGFRTAATWIHYAKTL
jgi:mycothiol synthase